MTTEPVQDVLCLAMPAEIDVEAYIRHPDDAVRAAFVNKLTEMAREQVWDQWTRTKPVRVEWSRIDWLITQDLADVETFQPAHDCPDCWLGNLQATEFLSKNPGRYIAMGNLTYTPIWGK